MADSDEVCDEVSGLGIERVGDAAFQTRPDAARSASPGRTQLGAVAIKFPIIE